MNFQARSLSTPYRALESLRGADDPGAESVKASSVRPGRGTTVGGPGYFDASLACSQGNSDSRTLGAMMPAYTSSNQCSAF